MGKKKFLAVIYVFLITFVISATLITAQADEATIMGKVVAADWDDNENLIAVSIETGSESYYVSDNPIGQELLELEGETVNVTGIIGEDEDGEKTIIVITYEPLSD